PSVAIAKAALPFPDGTRAAQIGPERFAILLTLPHAELSGVALQDFVAGVPRPVHERIVHQYEPAIAHARDGNENGAGLEGGAEPRFAIGQRRLGALSFAAQCKR